ncbi:MAG: class I tRNA ligase family protein [Candidatus Pacebacteria bacterium]|nr:class I tRNA ligase family protein [Candidatus Paceibacterota bacterium]MBP9772773.1 class I tRNA ligase family protein [Candidatus Paceibacterota bacterium]
MAENYNHKDIEKKWQDKWEADGIYSVPNQMPGKENFYQLVEFSYPSGNLHVGHWYAFSVPDIFARYKRMQGFNVLYPMGFDAFGLPAENAAIKLGADPKVWTYEQMEKMRAQLRTMGASFPWDREVVTCDPEYYRWTQWIFNQFLKNDLVYRAITKVNWCPKDQTILANEQVVDNKCERCGSEVIQRDQPQWMLRITKYADRLIDDLDKLAWPENIKESQKNWISRSEGSEIEFGIANTPTEWPNGRSEPFEKVSVFTTRADTLFGVTYIVLSPEHELISKIKEKIWNLEEVEKYIADTKKKSELDRQQSKNKTGVQVGGVMAINPANGEWVPVWIADYVLAGYGTGAVMAVPAHDERDFEFAKKYNLSMRQVIEPIDVNTGPGKDAYQDGIEEVSRENIVCIIEHPTEDKFLCAVWKQVDWKGFVTGGIEEGHTTEETARREIPEETGYKNIASIKVFDKSSHGLFYHVFKKHNRFAHYKIVHVKLADLDRDEVSPEEKSIADFVWVDGEKVHDFIMREDMRYPWRVFRNNTEECITSYGVLVDSGDFSNLRSEEARIKITEFVGGKMLKTYRLRDWGISRQRYWGCPIPIVYDPEGNAHPVPDEHLPWILPTDVDHTPDGTAPLARSKELFERTEKIFGAGWKPEVETMDTFVDSSWYFYRYLDNKNEKEFASMDSMDAWMPIDLYMGGAEHTTMHLLYSRFWTKALYDLGLVKDSEAYTVRRNRGLILGPDGEKMSKSRGNVINPDEIVERLGADTVRLYLAFMGPYGITTNYPWDPNGVVGVRRFIERVWKLKEKISDNANDIGTLLHKVIKKITEDIEEFKFNTAISQMMILINDLDKKDSISKDDYKILLKLLAPFAPHIAEELWNEMGESSSIHLTDWPKWDDSKIVDNENLIIIQVNGKVRAEITMPSGISEDEAVSMAKDNEKVKNWISDKDIKRVIYVPGRIINFVI